jgi:hypothetical protein
VGNLSRADLVRFITQLRSRTSDRLILCSYGQGHEHDERITGQFIDDPAAFRLNAATFEAEADPLLATQAIKSRPRGVGWKP